MTDGTELVPFDEGTYYQDPATFFARLRESCPVAPMRMPDTRRMWVVTRYADVRAAMADPKLAKDVHRWPSGALAWPSEAVGLHAHMLHHDGPDHTRLRGLVQQAFTPGRVARLRPRAAQIAAALLDDMAAAPGGTVDLLEAYARRLPITVICELLGVPEPDREWIGVAVVEYGDRDKSDRVNRQLAAYLADLVAKKRADPADDLISALVRARDDSARDGAESRLNDVELLSAVYQLIMAGFDTTANLIASGTLALLTHPDQLARLREDPSLLPAAVEELLRFTNPVKHATDSFTTEDTRIGDRPIPTGEWILLATTSANRDPARFPDPDRLDLTRDTSGHLAFGHGAHYCLGAPLARMEAEVALGALLTRFPALSLAVPAQDLRWRPTSLMNGLESLPVRPA